MSLRLRGKRAIVTGSAHGIGRASVLRFMLEGADVLAVDRDDVALTALACDSGCSTYALDLRDAVGIATLAETAGDVDVLFLCAGYVPTGTILDCTDEDWAAALDVNVTAMFRLIRAVLPGMLARGGGSIITMASVAGSVRGVPDRFAYAASKAAVIGLTKAIAVDFVTQRIRCNAICPGTIDTPSLEARIAATVQAEATKAAYLARQPMGRFGTAAEVAGLATYLASDEAAFTTGQCHVIDGGWAN